MFNNMIYTSVLPNTEKHSKSIFLISSHKNSSMTVEKYCNHIDHSIYLLRMAWLYVDLMSQEQKLVIPL